MSRITGLTKERVKSIIVCKDREFKAKAVQLLNGAAFPSEKYTVNSISDATDRANHDRTVLNLVIDGSMFSPDSLEEALQELERLNTNDQLNLLCILDEAQQEVKERYSEIFSRTFLEHFPLSQAHFNRAFHSKKSTRQSNIMHPPLENLEQVATVQPKAPALSIIETSKHLKDTIEMINQLKKDPSNIESALHIGQRFNGLIGAFHFFGSKEGFPKLRELAEMIDTVCRSYESQQHSLVEEEHLNFITEAAKCSYLILKDLRNGSAITSDQLLEHIKLVDQFKQLGNIRRRQNEDQQSVDKIIDAVIKKSS